jgi:hypothetical protein
VPVLQLLGTLTGVFLDRDLTVTLVSPTTKTDWEGTGMKPDIAVSEENASETALNAALENLD